MKKKKKKREKWWLPVRTEMAADEDQMSHRHWLMGDENYEKNYDWYAAIIKADMQKDLTPLIEVLRSCVPTEILPHLVDLSSRNKLQWKHGRDANKTPSYDRSTPEVMLEIGCEEVRWLVENEGKSVKTAIDEVAEEYGIPDGQLANAYAGKRGATRRKKKK